MSRVPKFSDRWLPSQNDLTTNKRQHSSATHASLYAKDYKKAERKLGALLHTNLADLTAEERERLSRPVPIRKGR